MAKGPGGFSVGRVSIQVVPDTSKFRKELKAELEKAVKGLKVEIPVDLDAAKAVAQLKALDTVLKKIDGRNVNIGANVNSNGDLEKISRDLSRVGRSANDAASGFSSVGRTGAIVLAVLVLIAPALALIATLLAGLPSLLFAFGAGALAVGLGMDGLKKAAKGFTPTIERLKASLSANFEKNLTKPFQELNKLAPVLDKGLNAVATSISRIITDIIRFVTSAKGMEQINTILQNTAKFFNLLSPAITDGMRALFTLAAEASKEFDVLAFTFQRFSREFLDMVNRVSDSGVLGSALRNLNIVLDQLLSSFTQFFEVGLKAMTVLGGPIVVLFDGFTKLIVALMPILTAVSKLVFDVLGEAFRQLAPVVEELTPGIQALGDTLGQLLVGALKALGPLLKIVAQILNDVLLRALQAIDPFIEPFIQFMTKLAEIVGQFLVAAFEALSPFLDTFFKFIQDLLIAITPLLPLLLDFATQVLKTMADVLKEMGPDLVSLGETLFPRLLKVITDLVPIVSDFLKVLIDVLPVLTDLAVVVLEVVIPVMTALMETVGIVWPAIKEIIEAAINNIKGIIDLVMGLISGDWDRAWNGLKRIMSSSLDLILAAIKLGLNVVVDAFIGLPERILGALFGLPEGLAKAGRSAIDGFVRGVKAQAQQAYDAVAGVVAKIRGLFPFSPAKTGPFSGTGYTTHSGKALMEDWAKGIEQGTPTAMAAIEEAMAQTQNGMDISAAVTSEGFGDLQGQIMTAMSGWEVVIDANGITKLVNKTNQRNSRR